MRLWGIALRQEPVLSRAVQPSPGPWTPTPTGPPEVSTSGLNGAANLPRPQRTWESAHAEVAELVDAMVHRPSEFIQYTGSAGVPARFPLRNLAALNAWGARADHGHSRVHAEEIPVAVEP